MKHLLLISLFISGTAMAQITCPTTPCAPEQNIHIGYGTSQPFTGNQCLKGPGVIDNASFRDYNYLSFKDSLIVKVPLDFTGGSKRLYVQNYISIDSLILDGNDTIFNLTDVGGGLSVIRKITFTGPGNTMLYMKAGNAIWIDGSYYTAGNIYTSGTGRLSVVACVTQPLALRPLTRSPFIPSITYHFIITDFFTGRQYRKECTYQQLIKSLPVSDYPVIIEAGGLRQKTIKKQ